MRTAAYNVNDISDRRRCENKIGVHSLLNLIKIKI